MFIIRSFLSNPTGYYDSAEGKTGNELKIALYSIIKNHTEYPHTSSSTDLWDIFKESDKDPENAENVILFYTGWSVNAAQEYNDGSGWSREHIWAKSRGDFGTTLGPGTDAHHLRPADISVNSARNNRWFDTCSIPYLDGGLETGCYTSDTRWVWQPRDEVKGDVTRMIFYMATRYEGENGEPDLVVIDSIPSDEYTNDPVHAKLSALLAWHQEDPVDDFERNRNEVVFSYQNNRNPFIDHPEYVNEIWGNDSDTCFITVIVYDTISVLDTTFLTVEDTVRIFDTTYIIVDDTIFVDVYDTISVSDTMYITVYDTVIVNIYDTVDVIKFTKVADIIDITDPVTGTTIQVMNYGDYLSPVNNS